MTTILLLGLALVADAGPLTVVSRVETAARPPEYLAAHVTPSGGTLIGPAGLSEDHGRTWTPFAATPDFKKGLPHGYRREPMPAVVDPHSGRVVIVSLALDTPGLDPSIVEPPVAQQAYYLRYRVSVDGGRTYLFDEPIVQSGDEFTEEHPFEGIFKGKNGIYLGDLGGIPLVTSRKEILVPTQFSPLRPDGTLDNPRKQLTYTQVMVLIGRWTADDRLSWSVSQPVVGDPERSTRGMIEPTLAEMPDGRILMVMRGSNSGAHDLPGHKWFSVSEDGGRTWTPAEVWSYDTGEAFFSPSSMSSLIRHSSGRVFWVGNMSPTNPEGNSPRFPVVMGEVDPKSLQLIKSSVIELDTRQPTDEGRVDLSHIWLREDRSTGQIVVTFPRGQNAYKKRTYATVRVGL